jgi:hypothetical protein
MRALWTDAIQYVGVPVDVGLRDGRGRKVKRLADPSGGRFDAAGDFDRFINEDWPGHVGALTLPVLRTVDIYGETEMPSALMGELLAEIAKIIPHAKAGSPELRGLLRLRVMAEECARDPDSVLCWRGD